MKSEPSDFDSLLTQLADGDLLSHLTPQEAMELERLLSQSRPAPILALPLSLRSKLWQHRREHELPTDDQGKVHIKLSDLGLSTETAKHVIDCIQTGTWQGPRDEPRPWEPDFVPPPPCEPK